MLRNSRTSSHQDIKGLVMNAIQKKCLSCTSGVKDQGEVRCTFWMHPGVMGGCGTEWAAHCDNYYRDSKGRKHVESRVVYDNS